MTTCRSNKPKSWELTFWFSVKKLLN